MNGVIISFRYIWHMDQTITGLIGFGTGGRIFHAPVIASMPQFKLKKISTRNEEQIAKARPLYEGTQFVEHADAILNDPEITLVIVATPNDSHYGLAEKALLRGKHVVVEKPFTASVAEATRLLELAEKVQRVLTVHHNRRWDSDFITVRKVIESNHLGKLVEYEAHFDRFRNVVKSESWKEESLTGSGLLFDLGSHLIDQALVLFGMPDEVFANLQIQRPHSKVTDQFELLLFYSGLKVTLKAGMLVREPLPHFILSGVNGSFVKYGMDVQEEALKTGQRPDSGIAWGEEPAEIYGTLNTDKDGQHIIEKIKSEKGDYRKFYENLNNAIQGKESLAVTPQQAKNTILIIELALKSNRAKRVIRLD